MIVGADKKKIKYVTNKHIAGVFSTLTTRMTSAPALRFSSQCIRRSLVAGPLVKQTLKSSRLFEPDPSLPFPPSHSSTIASQFSKYAAVGGKSMIDRSIERSSSSGRRRRRRCWRTRSPSCFRSTSATTYAASARRPSRSAFGKVNKITKPGKKNALLYWNQVLDRCSFPSCARFLMYHALERTIW